MAESEENEGDDSPLAEDTELDASSDDEGTIVTDSVGAPNVLADEDAEAVDEEEGGTTGIGSGVDEALEAWVAGGHSIDETEDADEVLPVQFAQLEERAAATRKPRMGRLNNVWVEITVELGRKDMTVREVTGLKEQDVIELSKLAGEPFDILVNERSFAEGEIVVVTDLMAVRITHLHDRTPPPEDVEE